jgi:gas vesicle protein
MGFGSKLLALGKGGALGAAAGAIAAALFAPKSGEQLQRDVNERIREAKIAGEDAQAAKQAELIERYRQGVDSTTALEHEKIAAQQTAVERVSAIGLGLNAPGALAAQETVLRHPEVVPEKQ